MTDSSTTADQTVLVLRPPRLPRATEPVEGAHYGVPKHVYDLEPMGCAVEVGPYDGQDIGDTVSINLNGELALDSDQTQGLNDTVTLHIPHFKLLVGVVNRLTYTVTRFGANMGTSTPPLEILYNSIRPGIEDVTPGDGAHSELELLLPDEIKNGVGPGFTRATVCVAYPYCRAYDRIRLNCNGRDVEHTVEVTQAPAPPDHGSPTPTTVCFDITSADLGNDHPQFRFSFTVNDQLNNSPDPDAPWSAVQTVDVDQAGIRLPQPIPREIASDAGDDPDTIDLEKLGANPLLLIVLTGDSRFIPGDTVEANYVAKVDGQPDVIVGPVTGTVETDELGQKKACVLTIPNDKVIPGSTVQASYRLLRNTALVGTSKIARATVIGQGGGLDLRPPSVKEAPGNSLDPVDAQYTLTVVVQEYDDMLATDLLSVTWNASAGVPPEGSHTTEPVEVGTVGDKEIPLPVSVLAFNLSKSVTVFYTVIRGTPKDSEELVLSVLPLPASALTKPRILEANDNDDVLNLNSISADATCWLGIWPHIAPDQDVWLRLKGTRADDSTPYDRNIWAPPPRGPRVNPTWISQEYYHVPAPYDYLKELKDGSTLTMEFKADLSQTTTEANAVIFPLRIYTVSAVELIAPTLTDIRDSQGSVVGSSTAETSVTVTGTGSSGQQIQLMDGETEIGAPVTILPPGTTWNTTLTGLDVKAYSLKAKALYDDQESPAKTFTVIAALVVEPSQVNLHAAHHRSHITPSHPPAGAFVDLRISGGEGSYTYSSSNPDVAEVNANGRVISKGSGLAVITVHDQSSQSATCSVSCANIRWYFGYTRGNYFNSNSWVQGQGGTLPTEAEHALLRTNYGGNGLAAGIGNADISRNWIPDPGGAPLGTKYVIDPRDGRKFTIMDFGGPSGASANADGYGVRNK